MTNCKNCNSGKLSIGLNKFYVILFFLALNIYVHWDSEFLALRGYMLLAHFLEIITVPLTIFIFTLKFPKITVKCKKCGSMYNGKNGEYIGKGLFLKK